MTKAREERERTGAWYGLKPGALYWNCSGRIVCSACSVPYPGSDTWHNEQWAMVTTRDIANAPDTPQGLTCEDCGAQRTYPETTRDQAMRSAVAFSLDRDGSRSELGQWAIERLKDGDTDPEEIMEQMAARAAFLAEEA